MWGSKHDNAQIKSSSALNLLLDFFFMAARVPVFEVHLAKRKPTQFQYQAIARQKFFRGPQVEKPLYTQTLISWCLHFDN